MPQQTSLDDLLVDEEDRHEELLTTTLSPFLGIGDSSGALIPTEEFEKLSSVPQTALVLLGRKAAYGLDLADEEGATPKEISEISGINYNTVKSAVRELDEEGLVDNSDGCYTVPPHSYDQVKALIEEEQ